METLPACDTGVHLHSMSDGKSNKHLLSEVVRMNDKLNKMSSEINGMKKELNITHKQMASIMFRINEISGVNI